MPIQPSENLPTFWQKIAITLPYPRCRGAGAVRLGGRARPLRRPRGRRPVTGRGQRERSAKIKLKIKKTDFEN